MAIQPFDVGADVFQAVEITEEASPFLFVLRRGIHQRERSAERMLVRKHLKMLLERDHLLHRIAVRKAEVHPRLRMRNMAMSNKRSHLLPPIKTADRNGHSRATVEYANI